jgi:hypothetical protein
MDEFNNLYKQYDISKYKKYIDFFLLLKEEFNIEEVLPDFLLDSFIDYKNDINKKVKELDSVSNYKPMYLNQIEMLSKLSSARIDGLIFLAYKEIEKNETILSTLETFKPFKGYSNQVSYNRDSTLTGRLTVKGGPRILTLPRRCRGILKSRYQKGKIVAIDFKSLEPRIARLISGQSASEDIYQEVIDNLDFDIDRSIIKRATISILFGSKSKSIGNLTDKMSNALFDYLYNYFSIDALKEKAKVVDSFEIRRNFYGRPLWNLDEKNDSIILNNYIQSTAVDLSLNCFSDLISKIEDKPAIPLFLIHDALILDVSEDYLESFKELVEEGYKCDLGFFPIEFSYITKGAEK